jgi:hypothetical protein
MRVLIQPRKNLYNDVFTPRGILENIDIKKNKELMYTTWKVVQGEHLSLSTV